MIIYNIFSHHAEEQVQHQPLLPTGKHVVIAGFDGKDVVDGAVSAAQGAHAGCAVQPDEADRPGQASNALQVIVLDMFTPIYYASHKEHCEWSAACTISFSTRSTFIHFCFPHFVAANVAKICHCHNSFATTGKSAEHVYMYGKLCTVSVRMSHSQFVSVLSAYFPCLCRPTLASMPLLVWWLRHRVLLVKTRRQMAGDAPCARPLSING